MLLKSRMNLYREVELIFHEVWQFNWQSHDSAKFPRSCVMNVMANRKAIIVDMKYSFRDFNELGRYIATQINFL